MSEDNTEFLTRISDTGIGIPPENVKNLFKLFGKMNKEVEANPQGIGLGLTICKYYAEMLGGKITVESEVDRGTSFVFTMPITWESINNDLIFDMEESKEMSSVNESLRENISKNIPYSFNTDITTKFFSHSKDNSVLGCPVPELAVSEIPLKCSCSQSLVVDDNDLNRVVLKNLLKHNDIRSDEAINGKQAIEKVMEKNKSSCCQNYSAIFMDINMPVMDGIQATSILKAQMRRKEIPNTPILAITAAVCHTPAEIKNYLDQGFDEFVSKPITALKVRELVQKYFGKPN